MVIHCFIKGRVQGVFFRQSTKEKADEFGITGWVKNLPNGDVEVMASCDEDTLDLFKSWLWKGPEHAQVEEILVENASEQDFTNFSVR